jgi:hypothetical protein
MARATILLALLTSALLGLGAVALPEPPAAPQVVTEVRGLIFSKTAGFRHDSIPDGIRGA